MVSVSYTLLLCLQAAEELAAQGISCEVIDLRTIVPLDIDTVIESVCKTGHLFIADEGFSMFGIAAEISQQVIESAFDELDAPVGRLHTEPVAAPFAPALERATFPNVANIAKGIKATLEGKPPVPIRLSLELARRNNPRASVSQAQVAAKPAPAPQAPAAAPPAPAANSSLIPVNVPNIDLTITEARVVRWLKNVGDAVTEGEGLLEVETDKSVVEIESPAAGRLARIIAPVDTVVKLMECVAEIDPS